MQQLEDLYPAIVFDFGGVLLDWNPQYLYQKLFNESLAMEDFLTEIGFVEWNVLQDKGRPFAEAVSELSERFPHYSDLINAYDERWEESIGGPIQTTVDLLYSLKQAGYSLYGLSNWSAETFQRIRNKYEFLSWFEDIVISGEVKMVKPDPHIYGLLLERIDRTAQECLFIDDSEANVEVAIELGFKTIRFESAQQLEEKLYGMGLLKRE